MSPRKRKKKKATNASPESAQVELLPGEDPAAAAPEGEPVASPGDASNGEDTGGGDRWAKAVGRRDPVRPPPKPASVQVGGVGAPGTAEREPEAATPTGESQEPDRADPEERARNARDHAAAGVRPAGEPLARAKELVGRGRIHEAMELYLGILTVNSSNLKAHNNLGVLFDGLKQYDVALEHFEQAERLAPENVEVLTNFATTLTSLARYEEAETLLRRAQRLAAEDVDVRLGIGILFFRRGLYAQAEAELRWVCARDRENGLAFYYRGEALNRLGRFDEAFKALEHAVTLLPSDPRSYYTLGHLYDRRAMPTEAAEMYRHARQLQGP